MVNSGDIAVIESLARLARDCKHLDYEDPRIKRQLKSLLNSPDEEHHKGGELVRWRNQVTDEQLKTLLDDAIRHIVRIWEHSNRKRRLKLETGGKKKSPLIELGNFLDILLGEIREQLAHSGIEKKQDEKKKALCVKADDIKARKTSVRLVALILIHTLQTVGETIRHCRSISLGSRAVPSPGDYENNCHRVFDSLREFALAYTEFRQKFEPYRKTLAKHIADYRLERPKRHLSHLEQLLTESGGFVEQFAQITNRGGDFRNWGREELWLRAEWWDSRKTLIGSRAIELLDALFNQYQNGVNIEALIQEDFKGSVLKEADVIEYETDPHDLTAQSANESQEPDIDTQNTRIKDGLYRDQKRFVWCGESYDDLSETMMNILEVLHKNYPNKTFEDEFENKIGTIQSGGFWKWFRVNRAELQGDHPVKKIVRGRINTGIYLKSKQ